MDGGKTLWSITSPPPPATTSLDQSISTDIAIIGAGYSGLSTALHLAEKGASVVVIEANEVGHGGSGRNAGHCTPTFQHYSLSDLRRRFGSPWGDRIIALQTGAGREVFDLITRHKIDCEAAQNGFLQVAHSPRAMALIERRRTEYAALGLGTRLIDSGEAANLTGSSRFHGGWIFEAAGHLNPLAYARGLARAAISSGAKLFTQTTVRAIERSGQGWRLTVGSGQSVTCDRILIATGAYSSDLWPGLSRTYARAGVACIASYPIEARHRSQILPCNHHALDTRGDFTNFRIDRSGRLITSVFVELSRGRNILRTMNYMSDRFAWLFPNLPRLSWEYYWTGSVDLHPDAFPQLLDLAPGVLAVAGYSSRGVPTATVMGRQIANYLSGTARENIDVPISVPKRLPFGFSLVPYLLLPFYRLRDGMAHGA
jgi:glycine/D-amino acid oxidase-like deaminating enzyme